MSKEERYAEQTVAWELPNGDSVTKSNYNLAGIETKYISIQTEVISDDKDKQISDLEAKLAEKDLRIEELESQFAYECECNKQFVECQKENEELKQQLAEKIQKYQMTDDNHTRLNEKYDLLESRHELLLEENLKLEQQLDEKEKEIEKILKENETLIVKHNVYTWGDEIQQDKIYAITGETLDFLINNQDKISFAVERLEQLKYSIRLDNADEETGDMPYVVDTNCLFEIIDNQIKQLKEVK